MDSNAKGTILVATYIIDKIKTEDIIASICIFSKDPQGIVSYIYKIIILD